MNATITESPNSMVPSAAVPGPGLSSRSRAPYGLSLMYYKTPPSSGAPDGASSVFGNVKCETLSDWREGSSSSSTTDGSAAQSNAIGLAPISRDEQSAK